MKHTFKTIKKETDAISDAIRYKAMSSGNEYLMGDGEPYPFMYGYLLAGVRIMLTTIRIEYPEVDVDRLLHDLKP